MAASQARIALRVFFAAALLLAAYYIGRPLYWKISATVHEIRERRQTVRQGRLLIDPSPLVSLLPVLTLGGDLLLSSFGRFVGDYAGSSEVGGLDSWPGSEGCQGCHS